MTLLDLTLFLGAEGADPASHVYNHPFIKSAGGYWLWSGHQGNLVLSAIIVILGGLFVASRVRTGPASQGSSAYVTTNRFAHMIEVICVYLREEIARPLLRDRTDKFMPILWTFFFFILVNNLLGLVPILDLVHLLVPAWKAQHITPIGGTATQNIWVTLVLAVISGVLFNIAAIIRLGMGGYFGHMTGGAPWYVAWMVFPIELAGQLLLKPGALAIRLFANMTGGHILLATLFSFVAAVWGRGLLLSGPVTVISVLGGIGVMFLELFVAFLQAFVFTFLTAVFISLMDHHEEHGHDHGHDHAHGHEPAPAH